MESSLKLSENLFDPEKKDNPSVPQLRAANPSRHVWVRASAGSGKTKVLVDRVLRLMLPNPETGEEGAPPERILCITFTKAGATNMALRIQERLLKWSIMDVEKLTKDLTELLGCDVDGRIITAARRLFAQLLDKPDRLRVLTIHSFCQSVLARFPVETGLSPSMSVMEEFESQRLQKQSFDYVLKTYIGTIKASESSGYLSPFVQFILDRMTFDQIRESSLALLSQREKLDKLRYQVINDNGEYDFITLYADRLNIPTAFIQNLDSWFNWSNKDFDIWRDLQAALMDVKGKTAQSFADRVRVMLSWSDAIRKANINEIIALAYMKPRSKDLEADSKFTAALSYWQNKIDEYLKAEEAVRTIGLLYVAFDCADKYKSLKLNENSLDYDDLILATQRLLSSSLSWVHYKLDGGIDHILLDESQDTSPAQWEIIKHLTSEMFAGNAASSGQKNDNPRARSLFVVGDEKQSIFSFQGADPNVFDEMLSYFKERVAPFQDYLEEQLIYSFRSTAPVLDSVDATFSNEQYARSLGYKGHETLLHRSYRNIHKNDHGGCVETWLELMPKNKEKADKEQHAEWKNPFVESVDLATGADTPQKRLLNRLVMRIKNEIQAGHWRAEDILILFRSRNAMMNNLIKLLKWNGVPVSGMDRLVLNDHIVIKDIIALAQFTMIPEDDFSLGCILKSPFIGWSEDDVFKVATARDEHETLWSYIKNNAATDPKYDAVCKWLSARQADAARAPVYEWLMGVLSTPCPADEAGSGYRACVKRFGAEIMDPLDEIIADSLALEMSDIRTLSDFIERFKAGCREIKRELSKPMGEVRIMTVHASKGLEAPVVIVPDTVTKLNHTKTDKIQWGYGAQAVDKQIATGNNQKEGTLIPLCGERNRSSVLNEWRERDLDKRRDEEKRLLYVAMTRAEDMLIVAGAYQPTEDYPTPSEETWFGMVTNGLNARSVAAADEKGLRRMGVPFSRLNKQASPVKESQNKDDIENNGANTPDVLADCLPDWLYEPIAATAAGGSDAGLTGLSSNVLNPSLAQANKPDTAKTKSVFDQNEQGRNRFMRGNITHRLLQILPELPKDQQRRIAETYVGRARFNLSSQIAQTIVDEVMAILNHPDFAPVFGVGSRAEVPIVGRLPSGQFVSGQIDRLYIGADTVLVVDYKTNRPSPEDPTLIPPQYRTQLALYKALLTEVHKGKTIRTALLWTDKALLMPVDV